MKKFVVLNLVMLMALIAGCEKKSDSSDEPAVSDNAKTAVPKDTEPASPAGALTDAVADAADKAEDAVKAVEDKVEAEVEKAVDTAKAAADLVPLELELPAPMFVGTPENLSGIDNLEPDSKQARPPFLVPAGVANISRGKTVTASEMDPIMGTIDMITDGDKEATEGSVVELGPFEQWAQIDLGEAKEIYAIVVWHFHKTARVYFDVVVQVSDDPEFITGVTTLFNNDIDNSLNLGAGNDMHYLDKAEGKLIDGKGTKGRYVRLYSQGNNQNDYSHYIEVEVFGK